MSAAPLGDGLRPGQHVVLSLGEKATHPTPAAPSCPNTHRPGWLLSGFHCPLDHALRATYGITCEDYHRLLRRQKGVCAICGRRPGKWRLAVDHDHESGVVRGLAHHRCQRWITTQVVHYLADPPGQALNVVVPKRKRGQLEAKAQAKAERTKAHPKQTTPVPPSQLAKLRAMTRKGT
jgi:hypothetical protein